MSKLTRREFVAGVSAMACAGEAQAQENGALLLWFKKPAETWTDALPIGNGRLGAMVFGGVWMLVDLDLTRIDPAPKRVNISLPGSLLSQIDSYAQTRHLSRSGFLAKAAQEAMSSE